MAAVRPTARWRRRTWSDDRPLAADTEIFVVIVVLAVVVVAVVVVVVALVFVVVVV